MPGPMTPQQRQRYAAALARCWGELTVLDAMLAGYPAADEVAADRAALELEDLARRLAALTACWEGEEGSPARAGLLGHR